LDHGEDRIKGKVPLTLQEAIEQKKVIVHETENVNELAVENTTDQEIFIQSGDLVKGGKQDRLLVFDLILHPKSGKLPIAAFCVEAGRWQQRGSESREVFAGEWIHRSYLSKK
jgi:ARG and Rhodanese-Phosphatase-superfamily-associated Protein domain